jgi:hypothetical protein
MLAASDGSAHPSFSRAMNVSAEVGQPLDAQQPDEVGDAVLLGASPELQ